MYKLSWNGITLEFRDKLNKGFERDILHFLAELAAIVKEEAIGPWMTTPNKAFDNRSPIQEIEENGLEALKEMLVSLGAGQ